MRERCGVTRASAGGSHARGEAQHPRAIARPGSSRAVEARAQKADHLAGIRVSSRLPLRVDQLTVTRHFEHTPGRLDEGDFAVRIRVSNLGLQTGGPGAVPSNAAVFNRYLHNGSFRVIGRHPK